MHLLLKIVFRVFHFCCTLKKVVNNGAIDILASAFKDLLLLRPIRFFTKIIQSKQNILVISKL